MIVRRNLTNFERIDRQLAYLKNHILVVGVLSDEHVEGVSVREYAVYNEYGTVNIPARPFFRSVTESNIGKTKIKERLDTEVNEVIQGNKSGQAALTALGIYIQSLIRESLLTGGWEANTTSTRNKKGARKPPLIDTGTLLKSISWEIRRR